ncbi:MAG: DUF4383 domain-containing protein [Candidatus Kaiserbacteria bacterium]|nr:DUF4383 domain-containing protein [Candidatus Kaiserbacteria bacterium]
MAKKLAWAFGIILTVVGILGFIPGVTSADGLLLGIFQVDAIHNIIHLATGIVAILVALGSGAYVNLYFKIFGIVYALVAIVGFVQGSTVLGLIGVNMADNVLHVLIAVIALWAGFWMKESSGSMAMNSPAGAM